MGPLNNGTRKMEGLRHLVLLKQCYSNYGPRPGTGPRRLAYRAADWHLEFLFCIVHFVQHENIVQFLY